MTLPGRAPPLAPPPLGAVIRFLPVAEGDASLVAALTARTHGAQAAFVERYGRYVERLLVRVVGFDPEVPDLLQEVFLRALESLDRLESPARLKGWLGSIALFTARAWLRDRRSRMRWLHFRSPFEIPEPAAPARVPEAVEALSRTYVLLDRLPADERIALALRLIEGMDLREIAELSRVSLATVKRRLARAEKQFLDAARRDPLLRDRIERGTRWSDR